MTVSTRVWRIVFAASLLAIGLPLGSSADETKSKAPKPGQYNPGDKTVDLFDAMKSGEVEVKLIPKDSTQARVFITNRTNQPLNVRLPNAFAGVPVLAQVGGAGGGLGGGGLGGGLGGGGNQGFGGGFGGGGGGAGGAGGAGGGFFNVPPERVGELRVTTVCLEHGKADPKPTVPYELRPIESFTSKPGVRELCSLLANGRIDQHTAQAAAWHLNNDMSWEELAAKTIERADGDAYPYFSRAEMFAAVAAADAAVKEAERLKLPEGATPSLSPTK